MPILKGLCWSHWVPAYQIAIVIFQKKKFDLNLGRHDKNKNKKSRIVHLLKKKKKRCTTYQMCIVIDIYYEVEPKGKKVGNSKLTL